VLKPPQITISATPTSGEYRLPVNFTATASDPDGSVISYYWISAMEATAFCRVRPTPIPAG